MYNALLQDWFTKWECIPLLSCQWSDHFYTHTNFWAWDVDWIVSTGVCADIIIFRPLCTSYLPGWVSLTTLIHNEHCLGACSRLLSLEARYGEEQVQHLVIYVITCNIPGVPFRHMHGSCAMWLGPGGGSGWGSVTLILRVGLVMQLVLEYCEFLIIIDSLQE